MNFSKGKGRILFIFVGSEVPAKGIRGYKSRDIEK